VGEGGTNHGGEDGGGGEERARETLLHPDGDGERGDGGRVRRRHPAGPDQLLRVPPVLLVPALSRARARQQIPSGGAQIRAPAEPRGEGRADAPGGEDLDGLRDGEGEHGGDERAVGEHGQVGERGRARRRGGGGGDSFHGSRPALETGRLGSGSLAVGLLDHRPRRLLTHLPPVLLLVAVQERGGRFVAADARKPGVTVRDQNLLRVPTIRPSSDPVKMHPRWRGGPFMTWSQVSLIYVLLKRFKRRKEYKLI
jgi:hypothetical protein